MQRTIRSLFFITGLVFFGQGQVFMWNLTTDKTAPYLLTSIAMILVAIYLKDDN